MSKALKVGLRLGLSLSLVTACTDSSVLDTGRWQLEYGNPTIDSIVVQCRQRNSRWQIDVVTAGWTGNGFLWFTDGQRYERHPLYSVLASPDGTADQLRLQVDIASDWRDAQSGRSTGFSCNEGALPNMFIAIRHPQDFSIEDCADVFFDEDILPDNEALEDTAEERIWSTVPLPSCPNVEHVFTAIESN